MRKIRRARRLPRAVWGALPSAYMFVTVATLGVRLLGYDRTRRLMARESGAAAAPDASGSGGPGLDSIVTAVDIACRNHPLRVRCLARSLALRRLLRSHGFAAVIQLGVRRTGEALTAHAWVELDGSVVGDAPDVAARFAPLEAPLGGRQIWIE